VRVPSIHQLLLTSYVSTQLHKVDGKYDTDRGLFLTRELGPCIRTVLQCLKPSAEAVFRKDLSFDAQMLVERSATIFADIGLLDFSDSAFSSSLIFVRPLSLTERYTHRLVIPTPTIARVLSTAVLRVTNAEQHIFFSRARWYPSIEAAAGWMYENLMHARLTVADGSIPGVDHEWQPCQIPTTTRIVPVIRDALLASDHLFYWRPLEANVSGIAPVILHDTRIWVFRTTINSMRASAIKGLDVVAQLFGPHDAKGRPWSWRLVAIGLSVEEAESLRNTDQHALGRPPTVEDGRHVRVRAHVRLSHRPS
jgi:hypothetical protein